MEKLNDLLGRMSYDIRRALYDKRSGAPKLDGWCGHEAHMLLRRDLPMIELGFIPRAKADAVILYGGISYHLDPGQDLNTITVCLNGAPIRRVDTKAMTVESVMGPVDVKALDLEALSYLFRHSDTFHTDRGGVLTARLMPGLADDAKPEEPIKMRTRHFSFREWKEKGLVYSPEKNVWTITLAGKNAIEQWRAFA